MALSITINKAAVANSFSAGTKVADIVVSGGTPPYAYELATGGDYFQISGTEVQVIADMDITNIQPFSVTATDSTSGIALTITSEEVYPNITATIQSRFNVSGRIYKITQDIDLGHGVLTIPSGCTLDFQGGLFYNGVLQGNQTCIKSSDYKIFEETSLSGTFDIPVVRVTWFGAKEDGVTDDSVELRNAIASARTISKAVLISGKLYVGSTINVNGVKIIGEHTPSGQTMYYTGSRVGKITFDFMKNTGQGATITFQEMLSDCYRGSCIVSDVASPVLQVTKSSEGSYGFDLENIGIIGWLRNETQVGLRCSIDSSLSYLAGNHNFNKVLVSDFGNNGVEIQSLEVQNIDDCEFSCNNGYGIKIEGIDSVDSPTEYVIFKSCKFNYNRLDGIYIKNSFRKQVKFANCNFQMPGQYELGAVNDSHGTRTIPSDRKDIIAGVRIENGALVGTTNRITNGLYFTDCYGEVVVKAVHLQFDLGARMLNNFSFTDNYFIKYGGSTNSLVLYISLGYMQTPYVWNNYANIDTNYVIAGSPEIVQVNADSTFLNSIPSASSFTNQMVRKISVSDLLNYPAVGEAYNTAGEEVSTVTVNLPSVIMNKYYPDTGSKIMFTLLIGYFRNTTTVKTAPVFDIVTVTRETATSYVMAKLTNNINSLDINATTGDITLECPAWNIVRVQRLDLINSYL